MSPPRPSSPPSPTAATPASVRVRHPGAEVAAFGPYATGGVIHEVDAATAERLLARGFERVPDAHPDPASASAA